MNYIVRCRRVLYSFQNITCTFRQTIKPNEKIVAFKTSHFGGPNLLSRRQFTSKHEVFNIAELEDDCATSVPSTDNKEFGFITNGDPELEKRLKVLFLEVEVLRQEGSYVPSSIKTDQWKELMNMTTRSARKKYLTFLWKNEMKRRNRELKKENKRKIREEELDMQTQQPDDGHLSYGLSQNTIFKRVRVSTMNHFDNCRLIQAMQFSQQLVIDCGYDKHMTKREAQNCAKQLMLLFAENRDHMDPFNLYLCNINRNSHTLQELHKFIKTLYDDHFPLNVTEQSYLELFPKDKLVYLTPHCREEMNTFDHDAVYIIGGIVDKTNQEPLSLAKAKKEGLRMAKLPLDRHLLWGSGSGKTLTVNHMVQILLDLRFTGDWKTALKHVPRRKVIEVGSQDNQLIDKRIMFRKKLFSKYKTASFK